MTAAPTVAPQRIFVTGATGAVGVHALPILISQGHEVTAIGRSPEKRARLQAIGARAIEVDTFDVDATRRALDGITTVINLATHMPSSSFQMMLPWKWRENDLLRREGSAALVQASLAAGVQRFIQESFAPIYEDGGDKWIDENWPLRPAPYNRTTLDAEHSAVHFTTQGHIGIIARFAGFYGAGCDDARDDGCREDGLFADARRAHRVLVVGCARGCCNGNRSVGGRARRRLQHQRRRAPLQT